MIQPVLFTLLPGDIAWHSQTLPPQARHMPHATGPPSPAAAYAVPEACDDVVQDADERRQPEMTAKTGGERRPAWPDITQFATTRRSDGVGGSHGDVAVSES